MKNPMDTAWIRAVQYGGIVAGIACAAFALWGYFNGWLHIGWIITLAYTEMVALLLAFVAWYVRWYWSDSFVERTARHAIKYELDPHFVERVVAAHPRKADILEEIVRQRSQ